MMSALKMDGNSFILAGGPGKAFYYRNVTVKKNLSGHVGMGRFTSGFYENLWKYRFIRHYSNLMIESKFLE